MRSRTGLIGWNFLAKLIVFISSHIPHLFYFRNGFNIRECLLLVKGIMCAVKRNLKQMILIGFLLSLWRSFVDHREVLVMILTRWYSMNRTIGGPIYSYRSQNKICPRQDIQYFLCENKFVFFILKFAFWIV